MSFDHKASDWDANPMHVERANAIAACMRRHAHLAPPMHGFEFGCGTGLLSFALRDAFGTITLADTSTGMLEVLRGKIAAAGIAHMQPLRIDLLADPKPAERYDVVYSAMTLHHVADTRRILEAWREILVDGGTLCIADLDAEDGSFHGDGFTGHHGFERDDLVRRLVAAGLDEVTVSDCGVLERDEGTYPMFLAVARSSQARTGGTGS